MRIVILCSSAYSESACAMAAHMAESGYVPVGTLALTTLDRGTLQRKLGQWGARDVARYARAKLIPQKANKQSQLRNSYLQPLLNHEDKLFRNLREVAAVYGFPIVTCSNQNSPHSIACLKEWSPDLIIFTGGNILRKPLLEVARLGVLNVHLALLPQIRGMSSPEWSLLKHVPVGVTIHYMDAGIDTGPVLQRYEFPGTAQCESLADLRNRLIAFGIEKAPEVVAALDCGTVSAKPQSDLDSDRNPNLDQDNQFFVMHEWLQARAAECLTNRRLAAVTGTVNE
jgi:folate-dependent phosphoribosylglycinamide formyltransferase PurN